MKPSKLLFFTFASLISFAGYSQKADSVSSKLLGKLIGTWTITSVSKGTAPLATNDRTPAKIKFKLDAKYILKTTKATLDSGSFNTNEVQSKVYLESITDKDHLQEWKIILNHDDLTMISEKGSKTAGLKYKCVRIKENQ